MIDKSRWAAPMPSKTTLPVMTLVKTPPRAVKPIASVMPVTSVRQTASSDTMCLSRSIKRGQESGFPVGQCGVSARLAGSVGNGFSELQRRGGASNVSLAGDTPDYHGSKVLQLGDEPGRGSGHVRRDRDCVVRSPNELGLLGGRHVQISRFSTRSECPSPKSSTLSFLCSRLPVVFARMLTSAPRARCCSDNDGVFPPLASSDVDVLQFATEESSEVDVMNRVFK